MTYSVSCARTHTLPPPVHKNLCFLPFAGETLVDLGDASLSAFYSEAQANLTDAINSQLWDDAAGAYIDNPKNTALHPQDGNSLAVWLNVTSPPERKARVLANLKNNWVRRIAAGFVHSYFY